MLKGRSARNDAYNKQNIKKKPPPPESSDSGED